VCRYDTIVWMKALGALACCCWALQAQAPGMPVPAAGDPVVVVSGHPRLFLSPARLRLLRRERERDSERWSQLQTALAGPATLPEPGFARALAYQISGDASAGRDAIAWALGPGDDLRQMALVFDWCQELLSAAQRDQLAARIVKGMAALASGESVPAVRSRVLAAVALYDHVPDIPERELERVVHGWWEGRIAPGLKVGGDWIPRDDAYALFELLHALRDSANLDLREACPRFFLNLPLDRLMSYYPAVYTGPAGDFRAGVEGAAGPPDPLLAYLSRAADLAIVAYDPGAEGSQALQGWLMHDRFAMRGGFGAPYEFLWADPYQPGLSYYHEPLTYFDADSGRLFVRSSWEDSAVWLGCWDGMARRFEDGRLSAIDPATAPPAQFDSAVVLFGQGPRAFRIQPEAGRRIFVAALQPRHPYQVEIQGRKPYPATSGPSGILDLTLPAGKEVSVRIR
jgi:hypothetical protein